MNPFTLTDEEAEFVMNCVSQTKLDGPTVGDRTTDQLLAVSVIAKIQGAESLEPKETQ